jgi:hypothetical protein
VQKTTLWAACGSADMELSHTGKPFISLEFPAFTAETVLAVPVPGQV